MIDVGVIVLLLVSTKYGLGLYDIYLLVKYTYDDSKSSALHLDTTMKINS